MPTGYNKDGTHNGIETRFKKGQVSLNKGKHWKIKDTSKMKGHKVWNVGLHVQTNNNLEIYRKNGGSNKGKHWKVKDPTNIIKARFGNKSRTGQKQTPEEIEKRVSQTRGEKHWRWIKDRTTLEPNRQKDPENNIWVKAVKMRDGYKCRINNCDCVTYVVAHHILPWRDYPELRYNINNGITLCLAHHPRKRAEEKRLAPMFQELVSVSN